METFNCRQLTKTNKQNDNNNKNQGDFTKKGKRKAQLMKIADVHD